MMKNIYNTGAFQLSQEDFRLNILYTDPSPINYISPVDRSIWPKVLDEEILLNTFGKTMKPFVFLSAGMKFSNFYKSMSISMKLNINCLGFLCGRSLWQDSIDIFCNQSNTEFIKWLENQGLERVEKLKSTLDL